MPSGSAKRNQKSSADSRPAKKAKLDSGKFFFFYIFTDFLERLPVLLIIEKYLKPSK